MRDIDRALPLDLSGLQEEEVAFRFFYASDGYLGWIMEIIREASIRAIDAECHALSMPLLAAGYEARLAGTEVGNGKINPFSRQDFTQATVEQLEYARTNKRPAKAVRPASGKGGRGKSTGGSQAR